MSSYIASKLKLAQDLKRKEFLKRQKNARRDQADIFRRELLASADIGEVKDGTFGHDNVGEIHKENSYSEENFTITNAEWMLDAPSFKPPTSEENILTDYAYDNEQEGWYIIPRPEGKQCYIETSLDSNYSTSKYPNNNVITSFRSSLPKNTIIECIYDEDNHIYYAIDVIRWKSVSMLETTCEFRFYWLRSKWNELSLQQITEHNEYPIHMVNYYECNYDNLLYAYENPCDYIKDGYLFYHKFAYYQLCCTPLVLNWKDHHSSRYLPCQGEKLKFNLIIKQMNHQTNDQGNGCVNTLSFEESNEQIILNNDDCDPSMLCESNCESKSYDENEFFHLCTYDGYPLLTLRGYDMNHYHFKPDDIVKCSIDRIITTDASNSFVSDYSTDASRSIINVDGMIIMMENLQIVKKITSKTKQKLPDNLSKIIFHYLLSCQQSLSFDQLIHSL
jgi:hypothetical protein